MPIVTAAVIAVGAAIATTTVATVATAALAVGTLVGTVGLGMSVIGMATGNKTLSKIGGYLGMAGGVMSLGGALAGGMAGYSSALSQAWDDGVGSLFSSTKPVGQQALGTVGETAAKATPVQSPTPSPTGVADTATPSLNVGPRPQQSAAFNDVLIPGEAAKNSLPSGVNPSGLSQTVTPGDMSQFASTAPSGAPSSTAQLSSVTAQANAAPQVGPPAGMPNMNEAANWLPNGTKAATSLGSEVTSGIGNFFKDLPDWAKAQVAISGAQGLAGMAGGWFESASAEEKLQLEREAQQWRMQHEDSIKNFNQQNASFAPRITFGGGGMLSKGANA